jgi:ABC-type amino acid transport substrate-binding protein
MEHTIGTWVGGLIGALQTGEIDMIAADLWPTEEHLPYFDFSKPYTISAIVTFASTIAASSEFEQFMNAQCF